MLRPNRSRGSRGWRTSRRPAGARPPKAPSRRPTAGRRSSRQNRLPASASGCRPPDPSPAAAQWRTARARRPWRAAAAAAAVASVRASAAADGGRLPPPRRCRRAAWAWRGAGPRPPSAALASQARLAEVRAGRTRRTAWRLGLGAASQSSFWFRSNGTRGRRERELWRTLLAALLAGLAAARQGSPLAVGCRRGRREAVGLSDGLPSRGGAACSVCRHDSGARPCSPRPLPARVGKTTASCTAARGPLCGRRRRSCAEPICGLRPSTRRPSPGSRTAKSRPRR